MLKPNEMKVLKKIVGKSKFDRIKTSKSENSTVSNKLMNGWKEEKNC